MATVLVTLKNRGNIRQQMHAIGNIFKYLFIMSKVPEIQEKSGILSKNNSAGAFKNGHVTNLVRRPAHPSHRDEGHFRALQSEKFS